MAIFQYEPHQPGGPTVKPEDTISREFAGLSECNRQTLSSFDIAATTHSAIEDR